jgi:hypothetical protein
MGDRGGTVIPNGGGGGGTVINVTYAPQYSSASPAEARQFAKAVLPELSREMRSQGVLPR